MSKRSVKINGVTTSLFLEEAFWNELERRAEIQNTTWSQYFRTLIHDHDTSGNRSAAIKEVLLLKLREDLDAALRTDNSENQKSYWLLEKHGKRDRVEFGKSVISIGRDQDNDIVLHDPEVADKHLLLVNDKQRWWAVDLNTTMGTTLNNKTITRALIPRRGEITVGNSQIIRV